MLQLRASGQDVVIMAVCLIPSLPPPVTRSTWLYSLSIDNGPQPQSNNLLLLTSTSSWPDAFLMLLSGPFVVVLCQFSLEALPCQGGGGSYPSSFVIFCVAHRLHLHLGKHRCPQGIVAIPLVCAPSCHCHSCCHKHHHCST